MTRRTYNDWNLFREHIAQDLIDYCNMQGKLLGYWAEMPQFARDKIRATRLRNEQYYLEQCKPCGELWLCVHETLYPKHPYTELAYVGIHPDPLHYSHAEEQDPRDLLRELLRR